MPAPATKPPQVVIRERWCSNPLALPDGTEVVFSPTGDIADQVSVRVERGQLVITSMRCRPLIVRPVAANVVRVEVEL